MTTAEVAEHLDISRRSTYDRLDRLCEQGKLQSKKVGGGGRVWWRQPDSPRTRQTHRRNHRLHEASEDVYVTLDRTGQFQSVSVDTVFGYDTETICGVDAFQFLHPDDRTEVRDQFETLVTSDEVAETHVEVRFRHADGSWIDLSIDAEDLLGDPLIQGVAIFARDVTKHRERQRELELYSSILDRVGEGVYVLDESYTFTLVNDTYVEMTGYDREELIGSDASLVVTEEIVERSRNLADSADGSVTLQADIQRADGTTLRAESQFAIVDGDDGDVWKVGAVRDISDRLADQRSLRTRVRQQEVIADLGRLALENGGLDTLMREATESLACVMDTDFSKVLELTDDGDSLLLRSGVGWSDEHIGTARVPAADTESHAAHTLHHDKPVVVEDIDQDERFATETLLGDYDVDSGITAIIGSTQNPWGVLGVHDQDRRAFTEHDAVFVQSVANILASAIDATAREQAMERKREQVAALNNLNTVVREITAGVIEQSTRADIEQTVCDHLASSDSYEFAWIGALDPYTETLEPRATSNDQGYLDDVTVSTDPADPAGQGPGGLAARTREPQVVQDVAASQSFEPWRDEASERGFGSGAAIPITTENSLYGILGVYTERSRAFEADELSVISQLGRTIGHAISAVERKEALMSDQVTELRFSIPNVGELIEIESIPGPVHFDEVVDAGDDRYMIYGRAVTVDEDAFRAAIDAIPGWESVRFVGDGSRFELLLTDPPVFSMIAARGGEIVEATFEDDEYRFTIHLPPAVDTRAIIEEIRTRYPVELLIRRQVSRDRSSGQVHALEELTDRQRAALQAAYHAGFFDWPRGTTGEELAESLDIAAPTFHQHLRRAEREIVGSLLE